MTIKNVTEEKEKVQKLIRFHSANKIDNYNRRGYKRGKKKKTEKKNPKESTEQVKTYE